MKHRIRIFLAVIVAAGAVHGGESVGWRFDGTGRFPGAKSVLEWSKEKNVIWKTATPNWSNASPVPVGDRLFVCAEPATLLCLSLADGSILWQRDHGYADVLSPEEAQRYKDGAAKLAEIDAELNPLEKKLRQLKRKRKEAPEDKTLTAELESLEPKVQALKEARKPFAEFGKPSTHGVNGYSTPTPVSDGRFVYVLFGNGVAAGYDMEGNRRWARIVGRPTLGWGHSPSPLLCENKLLVHVAKTVSALEPATGETLWSTESGSRWGTPALADAGDESVLITIGGDMIRVRDGEVLARRLGAFPWSSPLVHDGVLYVIDEKEARAVKLPESVSEPFEPDVLWSVKPPRDRYYATPLYCEGLVYNITRGGHLCVIDAASGEIVFDRKLKLGGTPYPSPCLVGQYVFISSDKGKTAILEPGREYKEVRVNTLEPFRSSPVFVGNRMIVRTLKHVFCIGAE